MVASLKKKKSYDQPRQRIKKLRHHFADKGAYSQSYGFSGDLIHRWDLNHTEGWGPNWCFWTVILEKTLESPSDCKEIQPVHPKGNQSWIFIGRSEVKLKLQYCGFLSLLHHHGKIYDFSFQVRYFLRPDKAPNNIVSNSGSKIGLYW